MQSELFCVCWDVMRVAVRKQKSNHRDGHIKMSFTLDENGIPFYNVSVGDSLLIENSAMGFTEGNGVALGEGFQIKSTTFDHKDEIWTQAWGENKRTGIIIMRWR